VPNANRSVLIVDDERATAWALAECLSEEGLTIRTAHTAAEAVLAHAAAPADLVITDIRLPDENGFALLERLASGAERPRAIVVSAWGGPEIAARVSRSGALAYVQKPFDVDRMKQLVLGAFALESR
jgi:DNA-binding NtrC family response regulator